MGLWVLFFVRQIPSRTMSLMGTMSISASALFVASDSIADDVVDGDSQHVCFDFCHFVALRT